MNPPPRRMGPLTPDHPLVTSDPPSNQCPACRKRFQEGDFVTLVVLGPGNDPEAQAAARAGRYYAAIALPIHWTCRTGLPDTSDLTPEE